MDGHERDRGDAESLTDVAIVGMSCRLPGADDVGRFWVNLRDGVDSVTHFSEEELSAAGVPADVLADPRYVRATGRLDGAEHFDAAFFGFSRREAEVMDPQQRVFLQCAWHALEHAGHVRAGQDGPIGVFAGAGMSSYLLHILLQEPSLVGTVGAAAVLHANDKDFLTSRTAYKLGLRGPSVTVQTACSTSLVAVHIACQSLLSGECDTALAGGVSVGVPQQAGYFFEPGGIVSPDGRCRAFDAEARGTVFGSGVGVVVLRRLADAARDRDTVYAVVKGTAVNNDGADKVGFTAPSVSGQAAVISEALGVAGVAAETVGYVEAHGTATELGDPIEVAALTQAFTAETTALQFCALGSVKSNVGHLNTAAGVAGLIKATLALRHREIPASLHVTRPNPRLELEDGPFYVNTALADWHAGDAPRRAGVSSFGVGGTNAHVVLEEYVEPDPAVADVQPAHLVVLSAKTEERLARQSDRLAGFCDTDPDVPLRDVAYTLMVGRESFDHRRILVCTSIADLRDGLRDPRSGAFASAAGPERRPVVFVFPGQGAQYAGMAGGLYTHEPVFRRHLDVSADALSAYGGADPRRTLFPSPQDGDRAVAVLDRTVHAQTALFAVEYALAQTLVEWGITPDALIGHSIGEYVAACVAGVLDLQDAARLVSGRAALMQGVPTGRMLAVALPEDEVRPLMTDELDLAATNGPRASIVAGPAVAVDALTQELARRGVAAMVLRTSHAFHSAMMDPVLEDFRALARQVRLSPPRIPFVSNVTGRWITDVEATDPDRWVRHLRGTVRFAEGVRLLAGDPARIYLEVGPGGSLGRLFARQAASSVFGVLRRDRADETAYLREQIGRVWLTGQSPDWPKLYSTPPRRIGLPTYPFERVRHWIDVPPAPLAAGASGPTPGADPPAWDGAMPVVSGAADPLPAIHGSGPDGPAVGGDVEAMIAALWQEVLGTAPAGPDDDFFAAGGHSLLALHLVSRVRDVYDVTLPLRAMLEQPTVAGLAALVEEVRTAMTAPPERPAPAQARPVAPAPTRYDGGVVVPGDADAGVGVGRPAAMRFSLFYFSADGSTSGEERYRVLLEAAEFADRNDFEAVWLPERHFHPFAGLYPNPSVLAAAVAVRTTSIGIRAGSVVLPLHHPVRVAEEWAMVDNLSGGRVGVSVASGWQRDDFVLAPPDSYDRRRELMRDHLEVLERLWAGEEVTLARDDGEPTAVRVYPRPRQAALPVWFTSSGSPTTWTAAGARGANVLTALISQSVDDLAANIRRYRAARAAHGHDPATGQVTLSLHTFVGDDLDAVRELVRGPLQNYLASHLELYRPLAEKSGIALSGADREDLLAFAFDRYFDTSALIGTLRTTAATVDRLRAIGVDEIACQVDFGLDDATVREGLDRLVALTRRSAPAGPASSRLPTPVVTLQRDGEGPPFFCIHPVDGSVLGFRGLASALGADRPFHALQAPGLEGEQQPREHVEDLADRYTEAILAVRPAGPYLLGGWSFGGVAAAEVARNLIAAGHDVPMVVMLDSRAPAQMARQLANMTDFLDRWEPYLPIAARLLSISGPAGVPADLAAQVAALPDGMAEELRALDDFPIGTILLTDENARRVCRAHIGAMQRFRPAPLPATRVTLVRAAIQPDVFGNDPFMGWGDLVSADFAVHVASGDHYTMLRTPHVSMLAAWLGQEFASAGTASDGLASAGRDLGRGGGR